MPEDLQRAEAAALGDGGPERNLKTDAGPGLHEKGGIFALVGATGVGKTTTAAKLAGLCARAHGAGSVGLITLDTYRVGAHEQLRACGRMLGVVAHLAHDRAALQDLLGLLGNKRMVLIDTTGLAPRDPRKRDMLTCWTCPVSTACWCSMRRPWRHAGRGGCLVQDRRVQQGILCCPRSTKPSSSARRTWTRAIRHQLVLRGVTTARMLGARLTGPPVVTALVAVAHGQQQGELPLLWALCNSLGRWVCRCWCSIMPRNPSV
jgi:flagellar biosynthesis protein FlhF